MFQNQYYFIFVKKIMLKKIYCLIQFFFLFYTVFAQETRIDVDYNTKTNFPLLKKISMYNAGIIQPYSNYDRDLDKMNVLNPLSLRLDIGIGKRGAQGGTPQVVTGEPGNYKYDFSTLDDLAKKLNSKNILPYYSWCYIPLPLQENNDWLNLNTNLKDWQKEWETIYAEYARHYRENGIRIGYHEIYNEPDLELLKTLSDKKSMKRFRGFLELSDFYCCYEDMYKFGVQGILKGDPDAVVGGPAFALSGKLSSFIKFVGENKLRLDFFSLHNYYDSHEWPNKIDTVSKWLTKINYKTTEIHVNELNWLNSFNGANDGAKSSQNYYRAIPKTFEVIDEIEKNSNISQISWAQCMESTFRDDPYGMIRKDGHLKAIYNVFKIFADMPVESNSVNNADKDLGVLASSDEHKATMVVWNKTNKKKNVKIDFANLPFTHADFRMYRIDSLHASYYDGAPENLEINEEHQGINKKNYKWNGEIPAYGAVYFTFNENKNVADFNPDASLRVLAKDIKTRHYYAERGKDNWADFDRKTWTAYLGSGSDDNAYSLVAVEAEHLPDTIFVETNITGAIKQLDKNSLLGIRLDYRNGTFTKSIVFHNGISDIQRNAEMPWGTEKQADQYEKVSLNKFVIIPALYAPQGWDGRVIISFIMQNTGKNNQVKFVLHK